MLWYHFISVYINVYHIISYIVYYYYILYISYIIMVIWIIIPASNGLKKTQTKIMLATHQPYQTPYLQGTALFVGLQELTDIGMVQILHWDEHLQQRRGFQKSHADVTVTVTHGDSLSFMIWASCKNAFFFASSNMITFLMATSLSLMFLSRPMKTLAAGAGQNKDLRGGKSMEIIPPMWFFCFDEWIRVYIVYHGILDCFQFMTFRIGYIYWGSVLLSATPYHSHQIRSHSCRCRNA